MRVKWLLSFFGRTALPNRAVFAKSPANPAKRSLRGNDDAARPLRRLLGIVFKTQSPRPSCRDLPSRNAADFAARTPFLLLSQIRSAILLLSQIRGEHNTLVRKSGSRRGPKSSTCTALDRPSTNGSQSSHLIAIHWGGTVKHRMRSRSDSHTARVVGTP